VQQSRYLPDGRDLNRSFPGSKRGSLAARQAELFMRHIVEGSDVGIDFHTGTSNRTNVPQIRADLEDLQTRKLAKKFGAPVMLHARTRDGSLREAAARKGITALLFEGGEALRFEDSVIQAGVDGAQRVMAALDMIDSSPRRRPTVWAENATWIRSRRAGLARLEAGLGDVVEAGQVLGKISDVRGGRSSTVKATSGGIVVGITQSPIVTQGDPLFNIASIKA
jgi:predicted deacylase